jgi:hypothetical protein
MMEQLFREKTINQGIICTPVILSIKNPAWTVTDLNEGLQSKDRLSYGTV